MRSVTMGAPGHELQIIQLSQTHLLGINLAMLGLVQRCLLYLALGHGCKKIAPRICAHRFILEAFISSFW